MFNKLISHIKPLLKPLIVITLIVAIAFGHANDALAAAGGGRIGGGSFRAPTPSRTYSAPRTYAPPGGGYYPGGGIGFPFVFPTFWLWGGGGSLFTLLIFFAVASFLVSSFRRAREDNEIGYDPVANSTISIARLQVGLLADARELQADLNKIALSADTSSSAGLTQVLQETTLALLRHPEYWTHASSTVEQARLAGAEAEFNRMLLTERSKFSREMLSNVNNQLRQAPIDAVVVGDDETGSLTTQSLNAPGEYIVVTLLTGVQGNLKLPAINNAEDLRQALGVLGGIASDRLLALEVLWTPQAEGDVLTRDDLIVEYPNLKLI
ncbi:putative membrane protein [Leptolyngbyaceae cyanobacterium JSC-12]|nr:putative membrane protein [Leptolyngbyaceae cyanobacterium JSC-12]